MLAPKKTLLAGQKKGRMERRREGSQTVGNWKLMV